MPFDNSWKALLNPGAATEYFTLLRRPPGGIEQGGLRQPAFEPQRTDYRASNAWWLAELSRLVYCEKSAVRRAAYARAGLRKRRFFDVDETEGVVVEARDRSFAVLAFRGTAQLEDWLVNLEVTAADWPQGGCVHEGFQEALDDVWDEITGVLDSLDSGTPVFYTGHSLGAALATLAASRRPPRALYTYGSPRVGDRGFAATLAKVPVFRVVNNRDVVTTLPPSLPHLKLAHAGQLRYITHDNRMLVDPSREEMKGDRKKASEALEDTVDRRRWFDPVQKLADHSPINYVTHLERHLE